MNQLYHTIFDALERYLVTEPWLQQIPVEFPPYVPSPHDEITVRASAIGHCPLESAHNKLKHPKTHPKTRHQQFAKDYRMAQGRIDGNFIQAGLVVTLDAKIEVPAEDMTIGCRGIIDVLLPDGTIIEVKRRDPRQGTDFPQPSISDCYQAMFYGYVRRTTNFHLLIAGRSFFKLWSFRRVLGGFVLEDENGDRWDSPDNTPKKLNFGTMKSLIRLNLSYMREEEGLPVPPFDINDSRTWLCYTWQSKPMRYKKPYKGADYRTGVATVNCEYFCRSNEPGPYRFGIDADGIIIPEWDERFSTLGIGSQDNQGEDTHDNKTTPDSSSS